MRRPRVWPVLVCALLGAAAPAAERPAPLDALAASFGGWTPLRAVRTFAYRLTRTDAQGVVMRDESYRLDLENGQVWSRDRRSGDEAWWDGAAGWRRPAAGGAAGRDDAAGRGCVRMRPSISSGCCAIRRRGRSGQGAAHPADSGRRGGVRGRTRSGERPDRREPFRPGRERRV
ncbi:hypothetical protein [Oleiharenicola sp. Vm1]|uniref:hypothetical protein n=1 Tax=Oleiharenicola sp. Vm1 TaxID=3398393 RepID=UPI0039F5EAC8